MPSCVAVIGGGITGLAAAHRLTELQPSAECLLLESADRLGGVLQTRQQDGFLVEGAADGFLTSPSAAVDLCRRLHLDDELIEPSSESRRALVLNRGRLLPVPLGFHLMAPSRLGPLLTTRILSLPGKLRAGLEWFLPTKAGDEDESLQSFVSRRFGRELFERLVQPLVGGIYTADAARLSIEATFPRFRQMERKYGSLIRAMLHERNEANRREASGARYGQFATLRGGMATLANSLANRLPTGTIRLDSPVTRLFPINKNRWLITIGGSRPRMLQVDGVVIAAPAHQSARLMEHTDSAAASDLRNIEYSGCAVVGLGYRREQIKHPLDSFGFVVPLAEQRMILSCSFSSVKYAGRSPDDSVLFRVFIGGECQSGLLGLSRDELAELAEREIAGLLRIEGSPVLRHVVRHAQAMPQYHVGHRDRVARIEARLKRFPTLALSGSALNGIGVPSCIQGGESAAERIEARLRDREAQTLQVTSN